MHRIRNWQNMVITSLLYLLIQLNYWTCWEQVSPLLHEEPWGHIKPKFSGDTCSLVMYMLKCALHCFFQFTIHTNSLQTCKVYFVSDSVFRFMKLADSYLFPKYFSTIDILLFTKPHSFLSHIVLSLSVLIN